MTLAELALGAALAINPVDYEAGREAYMIKKYELESYRKVEILPKENTVTGNWCKVEFHTLFPDCGYGTKEFCKALIREAKYEWAFCQTREKILPP